MSEPKRLHRSSNRKIAGVCGGLAEYLGLDPTVVRVIFAICLIFAAVSILVYLVMWLIMPE